WLTDSKWFITLVSAVLIAALVVITVVGFGVGKWVHKAGGVLMLGTFATLMLLPWVNVAHGSLPEYHPLTTAVPVVSVMSLNLLGKMGFGALGGLEYVAIPAVEWCNPVRAMRGAVAVAAPV